MMSGLIESLAMYPVTARGVCGVVEFRAVVEAAKAELAQLEAEPFLRL